jgi:hypothetical protein
LIGAPLHRSRSAKVAESVFGSSVQLVKVSRLLLQHDGTLVKPHGTLVRSKRSLKRKPQTELTSTRLGISA